MILEQGEWFQDDEMQNQARSIGDERMGKLLVSDLKCLQEVLTFVGEYKQTVATQKNASSTVSGVVGKSLTFRGQGDVRHVTGRLSLRGVRSSGSVRQEFCCVVLWRTHTGEPRGQGGDSCVD